MLEKEKEKVEEKSDDLFISELTPALIGALQLYSENNKKKNLEKNEMK